MVVTIVSITLLAAGIFVVAYFSPRKGQKIEDRMTEIRAKLTQYTRLLPDLLTKITRKSLKLTDKTVKKSAETGKKSRKKSPF